MSKKKRRIRVKTRIVYTKPNPKHVDYEDIYWDIRDRANVRGEKALYKKDDSEIDKTIKSKRKKYI